MKQFILLLVTMILIAGIIPASAAVVTVPERVTVTGKDITADQILAEVSEPLFVTRAANPGLIKRVSRRYLEIILKKNDLNITLAGPKFIEVETSYQELDITALRKQISNAVLTRLNFPRSDISISFRDISYRKKLPLGEVKTEISFSKNEDFKQSVVAYVSIYVDGEYYDRTYIRTDVRIWGDAYITTQPLKWNQHVAAGAVVKKKVEITNVPGELLTEEPAGYLANRNIPEGTILNSDLIKKKPLIQTGDNVKVISVSSNVMVSIQGEARQNGYKDKPIRVQNTSTGKMLTGTVIDENTVLVN